MVMAKVVTLAVQAKMTIAKPRKATCRQEERRKKKKEDLKQNNFEVYNIIYRR